MNGGLILLIVTSVFMNFQSSLAYFGSNLFYEFTSVDIQQGSCSASTQHDQEGWAMDLDPDKVCHIQFTELVEGPLPGYEAFHLSGDYELWNRFADVFETENACIKKPVECGGISISFWLNVQKWRDTYNQYQTICRTANTWKTTSGILVISNPDNMQLEFYVINPSKPGFKNVNSAFIHSSLVTGEWKWVAFTWKLGELIKVYLNGKEASASEYSKPPTMEEQSDIYGSWVFQAKLHFGSDLGADMFLDQYAFYSEALSSEKIAEIYETMVVEATTSTIRSTTTTSTLLTTTTAVTSPTRTIPPSTTLSTTTSPTTIATTTSTSPNELSATTESIEPPTSSTKIFTIYTTLQRSLSPTPGGEEVETISNDENTSKIQATLILLMVSAIIAAILIIITVCCIVTIMKRKRIYTPGVTMRVYEDNQTATK